MVRHCCNTETEDQVSLRVYQFMRDLTACRDWYGNTTTETVDVFYQEVKYVMLDIFGS